MRNPEQVSEWRKNFVAVGNELVKLIGKDAHVSHENNSDHLDVVWNKGAYMFRLSLDTFNGRIYCAVYSPRAPDGTLRSWRDWGILKVNGNTEESPTTKAGANASRDPIVAAKEIHKKLYGVYCELMGRIADKQQNLSNIQLATTVCFEGLQAFNPEIHKTWDSDQDKEWESIKFEGSYISWGKVHSNGFVSLMLKDLPEELACQILGAIHRFTEVEKGEAAKENGE